MLVEKLIKKNSCSADNVLNNAIITRYSFRINGGLYSGSEHEAGRTALLRLETRLVIIG